MILVWNRFESTPTITTVDTYYHPVWAIPFPAATLCNINKVYRPATPNIRGLLKKHNFTDQIIDNFLSNVSTLIVPKKIDVDSNILDAWQALVSNGYTTEKLLLELMQPCDKMLSHCYWLNQRIPCETAFEITKSSEGFCCSFNYKAKELFRNSKPDGKFRDYRVSGAGEDVGLELIVHPEPDTYQSYTNPVYGAVIIFHHPEHFVDVPPAPVGLQPGYFTKFALAPSILETDESVKSLSIRQRKCLFPDENNVEFITKYTFCSCMSECRMRVTLILCNCIPFYYPHLRKFNQIEYYRFHCQFLFRDAKVFVSSTM